MDPMDNLVVTIGQMQGGSTANIIPEEAYMAGTIRTMRNETRARVKERICEISQGIAASFNATAEVIYGAGCPVMSNNAEIYSQIKTALSGLDGAVVLDMDTDGEVMDSMGSEDFAYVADAVPSVFLILSAGNSGEGYCYPLHHPKTIMDENALAAGAAAYAQAAIEWLKMNK